MSNQRYTEGEVTAPRQDRSQQDIETEVRTLVSDWLSDISKLISPLTPVGNNQHHQNHNNNVLVDTSINTTNNTPSNTPNVPQTGTDTGNLGGFYVHPPPYRVFPAYSSPYYVHPTDSYPTEITMRSAPVIINNIIDSGKDNKVKQTKDSDDKENKKNKKDKENKKDNKQTHPLVYAAAAMTVTGLGTVLYNVYRSRTEKREELLNSTLLIENILTGNYFDDYCNSKYGMRLSDDINDKLLYIYSSSKKIAKYQHEQLLSNTVGLGVTGLSAVGCYLSNSYLPVVTLTTSSCYLIYKNITSWLYSDDKMSTIANQIQSDIDFVVSHPHLWFALTTNTQQNQFQDQSQNQDQEPFIAF